MPYIKADMKILMTQEVVDMLKAYREKFGEQFVRFQYGMFDWKDGKPAAQFYKEALQEALESDEPSPLKNQYPDDDFLY